jgi:hypothetical protein
VGEAFNPAGDCVPKALVDKPIKPVPIITGAVEEPPRPNERTSSEDLSGQREAAGQGKPPGQASGATKYWRLFLKKIDGVFGFE